MLIQLIDLSQHISYISLFIIAHASCFGETAHQTKLAVHVEKVVQTVQRTTSDSQGKD